jgi:alkanesulfonate monooxygenase SsuD/methylene tetrahydromethanopterin reductase-like flavin-dependent oxidoreductase (luciferase family)
MHTLNYRGKYFSVDGPLNLSRSVQGRPVLYTAGSSSTFMDHASSYTDGAFIHGQTMEDTMQVANELKARLIEKGRLPEDFVVITNQNPIVGRTDAEAVAKYKELLAFHPQNSLPAPLFFGSAERVAAQVQLWHESGAMDMLMIRQDHPHGLRDFIELVVPILQDRGIYKTEYEGDTLRDHLEIPKPGFRKVG